MLLSLRRAQRVLTLVLIPVCVTLVACGGEKEAPESTAAAPTPSATPTEVASAPTPKPGKCDEVKQELPEEQSEWSHPSSNFFEPDADNLPPQSDLDHLLLNDNAVVVTYAADTRKKTRQRLYDWTYKDVVKRTPVVLPDDSPDALPVRARIASVELRCNGFDWKRLTAFANRTDIAPLPEKG
ncbi:MAG TPA: hypothetical protein VNS09_22345 [Solirubrobacter sp.]|nr:hypothetical protein [Solirubrobacter sp.]